MGQTGKIRARDGWLVGLVLAGLFAVAIAARAKPVIEATPRLHTETGAPRTPPAPDPNLHDTGQLGHPHSSSWHVPWWLLTGLAEVAVVLLVLLAVLLLVRLAPGRREQRRRAERVDDEVRYAPADPRRLTDEVSATFEAALAGLRRGDAELAIVACWLRLEQLAESIGLAAQRSQTSSELTDRWLQVLPSSRHSLTELAELYREARFSDHRMSAESAERARLALSQLRADVGSRVLAASDV